MNINLFSGDETVASKPVNRFQMPKKNIYSHEKKKNCENWFLGYLHVQLIGGIWVASTHNDDVHVHFFVLLLGCEQALPGYIKGRERCIAVPIGKPPIPKTLIL